jgi:hypothetical protein
MISKPNPGISRDDAGVISADPISLGCSVECRRVHGMLGRQISHHHVQHFQLVAPMDEMWLVLWAVFSTVPE